MLGQGTTLGERQAMTLMTAIEQTMRTPRLCCVLAAEPAAASVARRLVGDCFASRLSAGVVADVGLVLTELVANAVTATGDSGFVEFAAWLADDAVVVQVVDQASGVPRRCDGNEFAESGRGLFLVEELTRDWGWSPFPGGKAVWGLVPVATHAS